MCNLPELQEVLLDYDGLNRCFQSKPEGIYDVAIIGDSHAEAYFIGLAQNLPAQNIVFLITSPSPHISDGIKMKRIYEWLSLHKEIEFVLLNGFWQRKGLSEKDLTQDIEALQSPSRRIILTSDVPEFPFDASVCKYRLSIVNNSSTCQYQNSYSFAKNRQVVAKINKVAEKYSFVEAVDTHSQFCVGDICRMDHKGDILFRDTDHLNKVGSEFIGQFIVKNTGLAPLIESDSDSAIPPFE